MELEANPDYYRGRPRIAKVVLKFGDSAGSGALPELLSGNVDAAANIRRADVLKLAGDARFGVYDQSDSSLATVLLWNHRNPLFGDARVRRALTLAIHRHELFQALNLPADTPVMDGPSSKRQFRLRHLPAPIPYDPEQANRLLDEAGWLKRNREGLRERDAMPFRFTVITGKELAQDDAAVYIQAQLKRIGIRMEIQILDGGIQWQRAITGDYEAAINRVFTDWNPGNNIERFLQHAGYVNQRLPELANRLRTPLAPDEEDKVYAGLTKLFQQDVPATYLYPWVSTTVAHRRVRGLDRSPNPGDLTWCMDELSLDGMQR
jgi:peptide/nickel transport system substrate-binding protein